MDLTFLVVDDSVTMRRIVVNTLKNIGFVNYVEAADGKEALQKLHANTNINFVITDWNMPEMSGLELVKSIRGDENFANLPILMVTTRGVKEDIVEALKVKVSNYVVKPFTPAVLKDKIDQILSQ
ncbi:MAG: response regulator [Melioribacteraceae bacterium]|nr:response regulator [Melioribacteraceae bacterium]MCF8353744.1 response regulator [Melioribacteraceae bacterium]MCF8392447.1 response regulator [Melioribacteraceae bacterium]MCF8418358.1 response regulator [Melioribacteraceae bacterium]